MIAVRPIYWFSISPAVYTHSIIIFYLMFALRCTKADIVATVSSPLSLLPVINYLQCHCYRRLIVAGMIKLMKIRDSNLSPVTITPMIIFRRCHLHLWTEQLIAEVNNSGNKHKVVNISVNFGKNLKWNTRGPRVNWIMIKTWIQTPRVRLPLMPYLRFNAYWESTVKQYSSKYQWAKIPHHILRITWRYKYDIIQPLHSPHCCCLPSRRKRIFSWDTRGWRGRSAWCSCNAGSLCTFRSVCSTEERTTLVNHLLALLFNIFILKFLLQKTHLK